MRINQRIRVPEVRVIMDDGEQKGIIPTKQALQLALEQGLDLVEISPRSHPPVCRIMDYGKFKYEQAKKKQQAKKHASTVELKELKFRPKTEEHDMQTKIKHVRRFLDEGNKCRLVIVFRGREITHPETGVAVLNRVVEATQDMANVEAQPNIEGRRMVMILSPKPGLSRAKPRVPVKEPGQAEGPARAAEAPKVRREGEEDDDDDDDDFDDDFDDDIEEEVE